MVGSEETKEVKNEIVYKLSFLTLYYKTNDIFRLIVTIHRKKVSQDPSKKKSRDGFYRAKSYFLFCGEGEGMNTARLEKHPTNPKAKATLRKIMHEWGSEQRLLTPLAPLGAKK